MMYWSVGVVTSDIMIVRTMITTLGNFDSASSSFLSCMGRKFQTQTRVVSQIGAKHSKKQGAFKISP